MRRRCRMDQAQGLQPDSFRSQHLRIFESMPGGLRPGKTESGRRRIKMSEPSDVGCYMDLEASCAQCAVELTEIDTLSSGKTFHWSRRSLLDFECTPVAGYTERTRSTAPIFI